MSDDRFKSNIALALHIASRYWSVPEHRRDLRRRGFDLDDVRQTALWGLWLCVPDFDPSQPAKFGTFAWPCIWRRLQALTARRRVPTPVSMPSEIPHHDETAHDPAELAADRDYAALVASTLGGALEELPRLWAKALRLRAAGATFAEIGQRFGVSSEAARGWVNRARHRLASRQDLAALVEG